MRSKLLIGLVLVCALLVAISVVTPETRGAAPEPIGGCPVLPSDNIWNTRVDRLPVHPRSQQFVAAIGATATLHPDFGAATYNGGPIGIPYVIVPQNQPLVPISFTYASESDRGPYPIPPNPPIEGGAASDGDRHVLIVQQGTCRLYEIFGAYPNNDGTWRGGSGAVFDLRSNALRPDTWTSADAAGLPILPGLVRYEEVAAGEIRHAIRFTAPDTRSAHVWPARHDASDLTDLRYPPMGQRFRLRASVDLTPFSPQTRVVLRAMQQYGMILADNGSPWFIGGVPHPSWDDDALVRELRLLHGSDFEAIEVAGVQIDPNSGQALELRMGGFLPQTRR